MSTRGRPREFDRKDALRTAMELFWRYGYEGTSVAQLGNAMGITSPSLYAAFGSKDELYRESVDLYVKEASTPALKILDETPRVDDAVERFLRTLARQFTRGPAGQRGCMIATGDVVCAPGNAGVAAEMSARRARAEGAIRARLLRAVDKRQLPPTADVKGLAAYLTAVIQGMSVQARDGASFRRLNDIVSHALRAWPLCTRSRGARGDYRGDGRAKHARR